MIHQAVSLANERGCQALIVLGDLCSPFALAALGPFKGRIYGVFGNNDGDRLRLDRAANLIGADFSPDPRPLELGGKRFFLMHEPFLLEEAAQSGRYDYILYGHLHQTDDRSFGNCRILSPGELGGWLGRATMMIMQTDDDRIEQITLVREPKP
jgi:putative phosphoesterase